MKLSIITINYNNYCGLQKTLESVFGQTFTDYEYIIIDGGSTDGSKELIEKYKNEFVYWVSEKDEGVYQAMNKGITKASGEYLLFLNSGDSLYSDNSLKVFHESSDADIVYANIWVNSSEGNWIKTYPSTLTFGYFLQDTLPHPASLIKKSLFQNCGLYNEQNEIVSDWEFFMNAICLYKATYKYLDCILSVFNYDGMSSKMENQILIKEEKDRVLNKYYGAFLPDYQNAAEIKETLGIIKSQQEKDREGKFNNMITRLFKIY